MKGETVVVERRTQAGGNAHGQPIYAWAQESVDNVLVAPGPRTDIPDPVRPAGVIVKWTLYFPRTFPGNLDGARVIVRGQPACPVIGDPQHWPADLTPTDWSLVAELSRVDG